MKPATMKIINGNMFEIYPLNAKEGIKVLTRLTKIIGEPLGLIGDQVAAGPSSGGGILKKVLDSNIPSDVFGKAARALVERLDENEVEDTIFLLLSKVHGQFEGDRGPRVIRPDIDFAGKLGLMFKVVFATLEVNFADFFDGNLGEVITKSSESRAMKQPAEMSIG